VALIKQWFGDKITVTSIRDPGTTGNFEVLVAGELVHSKKTKDHGFLHENAAQQAVVKASIEKALVRRMAEYHFGE
jgi:predicted Rdx family selenoprotein